METRFRPVKEQRFCALPLVIKPSSYSFARFPHSTLLFMATDLRHILPTVANHARSP
jgi:hypothetical protein